MHNKASQFASKLAGLVSLASAGRRYANRNYMRTLLIILCVFTLASCGSLRPKSERIVSNEIIPKVNLTFSDSVDGLAKNINSVFQDNGWTILHSSEKAPLPRGSSIDKEDNRTYVKLSEYWLWKPALSDVNKPEYFIKGKTPTSAFSFGSYFYIILSKSEINKVNASFVLITTQYAEKKKLGEYTDSLINGLHSKYSHNK